MPCIHACVADFATACMLVWQIQHVAQHMGPHATACKPVRRIMCLHACVCGRRCGACVAEYANACLPMEQIQLTQQIMRLHVWQLKLV